MTISLRRAAALALGFLVLATAPTVRPAVGQEVPAAPAALPPMDEQQFDAWTVRCTKVESGAQKRCEMVQMVREGDGGRELLLMAVGYPPGETRLLAWLVLPLGVLLPPGLGLKVDEGEPARLPIQYCEPTGCLAPWAPTEAELSKLKAGQKLVVIVHDRNGKQFGLLVSLKGFTAALAELQ